MPQKFETEIAVRPHEIDWNRHVNQSVYLDYPRRHPEQILNLG